jgi:hypothetical protein
MLGRKNDRQEELDHARTAVDQQLAAYRKLVEAIGHATPDPRVTAALEAFEPLFLNNMTIVLDRYFVHRLRMVTGKDGVLRGNNVIKLIPDQSIVKLEIGDRIRLSGEQFERLSKAFLGEIESKFV